MSPGRLTEVDAVQHRTIHCDAGVGIVSMLAERVVQDAVLDIKNELLIPIRHAVVERYYPARRLGVIQADTEDIQVGFRTQVPDDIG